MDELEIEQADKEAMWEWREKVQRGIYKIAAAIKHNTEQLEVSGGTVSAAIDRNADAIDRNTAQMERMEALEAFRLVCDYGPNDEGRARIWMAQILGKEIARIRAEKQAPIEGGDRGNAPASSG